MANGIEDSTIFSLPKDAIEEFANRSSVDRLELKSVDGANTSESRDGGALFESLFQIPFPQGKDVLLECPRPVVAPVDWLTLIPQVV